MSGPSEFFRAIVVGDIDEVARRLASNPALAVSPADVGATRAEAATFFFAEIGHYMYAGDTPLHMAAAASQYRMIELLLAYGAPRRARNRRDAEPLHYAADGDRRDGAAQARTIACLIAAGADPNTVDRSGVSPIHRAVRTRSLAAVRALLDGGADVRRPNASGSTPLHLAVQTTGRGGSGTAQARTQQVAIVRLLLERGARPDDRDGRGRQVSVAAVGDWVRALVS